MFGLLTSTSGRGEISFIDFYQFSATSFPVVGKQHSVLLRRLMVAKFPLSDWLDTISHLIGRALGISRARPVDRADDGPVSRFGGGGDGVCVIRTINERARYSHHPRTLFSGTAES